MLGIGDPNLSFEPVGSDGSVLPYMDLEAFAASSDMTINGLHFVSSDITIGGANSVDLQRGDLLFWKGHVARPGGQQVLERQRLRPAFTGCPSKKQGTGDGANGRLTGS